MNIRTLLTSVMLIMASLSGAAQTKVELPLWPSGAPNDNGDPTDTARIIAFLPAEEQATGRAVVICPGGGYEYLAMWHEGQGWAPYFNRLGMASIVLKYRLPHGHSFVPLTDAEEAMRLVRRHAAEWHIDPARIGVMGSSAGGHLASSLATMGAADTRPAFQILFYPVISMVPGVTHQGSHDNLLGPHAEKDTEQHFSTDTRVTESTPRAFIALSDDDRTVVPTNGINYYLELYRHGVPASLHVYPSGGHGWGIGLEFRYHLDMEFNLRSWLESFD